LYRYKVIWFDDEHASLNIIREKAFLNDIDLIGFGSAKQGIEELEKNIKSYDAAIVDGLFFHDFDQLGTPTSDKPFSIVAIALEKLAPVKILPWFILSGQASFTKEKNRFADAWKDNKVYDKLNDDHLSNLWADIKLESEKQVETQIRLKYERVFEVCTAKYIGDEAQDILLHVLSEIEKPGLNFDDELYFTQLRMILESMFRSANRVGLLHDDCLKGGKVNLTESSHFLSGEVTKYLGVKCSIQHFSKIVSDNVRSILFITGAASHTFDPEIKNNINLAQYRKIVNTPYLLYSLTFQLMDILIWFKRYVDENPDIDKNKSLWTTVKDSLGNWSTGQVVNISESKGFAFFKPDNGPSNTFIPPSIVSENSLSNLDRVAVIVEEYQEIKTKEIKTRVKELKKIAE
jgi:cold shock CspA family protein